MVKVGEAPAAQNQYIGRQIKACNEPIPSSKIERKINAKEARVIPVIFMPQIFVWISLGNFRSREFFPPTSITDYASNDCIVGTNASP